MSLSVEGTDRIVNVHHAYSKHHHLARYLGNDCQHAIILMGMMIFLLWTSVPVGSFATVKTLLLSCVRGVLGIRSRFEMVPFTSAPSRRADTEL